MVVLLSFPISTGAPDKGEACGRAASLLGEKVGIVVVVSLSPAATPSNAECSSGPRARLPREQAQGREKALVAVGKESGFVESRNFEKRWRGIQRVDAREVAIGPSVSVNGVCYDGGLEFTETHVRWLSSLSDRNERDVEPPALLPSSAAGQESDVSDEPEEQEWDIFRDSILRYAGYSNEACPIDQLTLLLFVYFKEEEEEKEIKTKPGSLSTHGFRAGR